MEDIPSRSPSVDVLNLTRTERPSAGAQDERTQDVHRRAGLPAVLDVPEAAQLLGIGRTLAYELVRTNQWPTPVIRMGRLIKIPSGPIVELMTTGVATHQRAAS